MGRIMYTSALLWLAAFELASSHDNNQQLLTHETSLNHVQSKLADHKIIPEVIDDFEPILGLHVTYPASRTKAKLGNSIAPSDVQSEPVIQIRSHSGLSLGSTKYTLVLTDPDAPSRKDPKWAEVCHWIVTNITLESSSGSAMLYDVSGPTADEVVPYMPPGPPPKTGSHRYVFLLFEPEIGSSPGTLTKPGGRKRWGTGKIRHGARPWAKQNALVPVGANFFYSTHEK